MVQNSQIALSKEHMITLRAYGMDTSDASMCWLREPNERGWFLVKHDEDCYEMGCLDPVPAYTLEDILQKIKGGIIYNPIIAKSGNRPWTYSILKNDHELLKDSILTYGYTPL